MMRHGQPVLYTADLTGCTLLTAAKPADIAAAFTAVLQSAGATVVQEMSHLYPGAGLTCVLVLRESHAVLHTWPETGYAAVDLLTCRADSDLPRVVDCVRAALGATQLDVRVIERAQPTPRADA